MPIAHIIGGGIAGCAAALALARIGWQVSVFEKRDGPSSEGAGIQISPNARRVLDALEVDLSGQLSFPQRIELHSANRSAPLAKYELGRDFVRGFGAEYAVATRSALQHALWQKCSEHPDITMHTGADAADAGDAHLVVGADGVASNTRRMVAKAIPALSSGYIACRAVVGMDDDTAAHIPTEAVCLWFGSGAHCVSYPLPDRKLNLVLSAKGHVETSGWSHAAPTSLTGAILKQLSDRLAPLADGVQFSQWDIRSTPVRTPWHHGKTVLIGDAAHAMPPFAAQGSAMALEDAVVLAAELQKADNLSEGLKAYEARRRNRVEKVANLARSNAKLYHLSGPMAAARNLALQATPEAIVNARMGWIYNWQPPDLISA